MNHSMHRIGWMMMAGLAAAVAVTGGCRGDRSNSPPRQFFPDMDDQPKWKPQSGSEFFVDGRTMRKPVPGSVPFGAYGFVSQAEWAQDFMVDRAAYLKEGLDEYEGVGPDSDYLAVAPVPVNLAMLTRGRERFDIYCAVCHGYSGDGKGMVGTQWAYPLPNFHDEKYKNRAEKTGKDGYIFHTIRYGVVGPDGVQKMPSYAHAVSVEDAWAIVGYIRVLQESQQGVPLTEVPEAQRQILQQRMQGISAPAPGGVAPAATPPAPSGAGPAAGTSGGQS